jgi:hypothetical protein
MTALVDEGSAVDALTVNESICASPRAPEKKEEGRKG